MASVSLQGIPDEVSEGLRHLAALCDPSLQNKARLMLGRKVRCGRGWAAALARRRFEPPLVAAQHLHLYRQLLAGVGL